jgi:hypothetical protein
MFEVGKSYKITMWSDDDNKGILTEHSGCKVVETAMPLIKIKQSLTEPVIINTTSLAFVRAMLEVDDNS